MSKSHSIHLTHPRSTDPLGEPIDYSSLTTGSLIVMADLALATGSFDAALVKELVSRLRESSARDQGWFDQNA